MNYVNYVNYKAVKYYMSENWANCIVKDCRKNYQKACPQVRKRDELKKEGSSIGARDYTVLQ